MFVFFVYRPRRPEKTVVYQLVRQNLETWLAQTREADQSSLLYQMTYPRSEDSEAGHLVPMFSLSMDSW